MLQNCCAIRHSLPTTFSKQYCAQNRTRKTVVQRSNCSRDKSGLLDTSCAAGMQEALLDAGSAPYGVAPSSLLNKVEQAVFGVFHVSGCRRWAVSRPPPFPPPAVKNVSRCSGVLTAVSVGFVCILCGMCTYVCVSGDDGMTLTKAVCGSAALPLRRCPRCVVFERCTVGSAPASGARFDAPASCVCVIVSGKAQAAAGVAATGEWCGDGGNNSGGS